MKEVNIMKFALNLIFACIALLSVAVGALYLKNKENEKYVEIYSNEYV